MSPLLEFFNQDGTPTTASSSRDVGALPKGTTIWVAKTWYQSNLSFMCAWPQTWWEQELDKVNIQLYLLEACGRNMTLTDWTKLPRTRPGVLPKEHRRLEVTVVTVHPSMRYLIARIKGEPRLTFPTGQVHQFELPQFAAAAMYHEVTAFQVQQEELTLADSPPGSCVYALVKSILHLPKCGVVGMDTLERFPTSEWFMWIHADDLPLYLRRSARAALTVVYQAKCVPYKPSPLLLDKGEHKELLLKEACVRLTR